MLLVEERHYNLLEAITCLRGKYCLIIIVLINSNHLLEFRMSVRQSKRLREKSHKGPDVPESNQMAQTLIDVTSINPQHLGERQQYAVVKFLNCLQRLQRFNLQPLQTQKASPQQYPFILPYNNCCFLVHLGPQSGDFDLQGQEKIHQSVQSYILNCRKEYFAQQTIRAQNQNLQENNPNNNQSKLPQRPSEVKQEEEEQPQPLVPQQSQANVEAAIEQDGDQQQEAQPRPIKFTTTENLSQINHHEEAKKIRLRYKARQEGKVVKRIRKTKDQVQIDLRQGIDPKETKNIPKNYAKAIMTYLIKNDTLIDKYNQDPQFKIEFLEFLQNMKLAIQNIKQFKAMLSDKEISPKHAEFNRIFRIISRYFLKNHAIRYIFHSRITQKSWHIKYRTDLLRAIKNPASFRKVKPRKHD